MLSRYKVTLLNRALVREASQPLQKQLLPFPTAQAADCISVSCQLLFSLHKNLSNELLKTPGLEGLSYKFLRLKRGGASADGSRCAESA